LTDKRACCSTEAGQRRGEWRFPNDTTVGEDTTADVYLSRGFSSLLLNRGNNAVVPIGVYTCTIPDNSHTAIIAVTIKRSGEYRQFVAMMECATCR
jgi:hypothetical protein